MSLDATYVLEISDGLQEGWWSPVSSSTATSITVSDSFPAALAADVKVTVRKFATIYSTFGANSLGLNDIDGVDSNPPDEIQILNPLDQSARTIAYVTGVAPDGWYDIVTLAPADQDIIYPGTSVKIVRYAASDLSLVASGEVKTTKTQVDVYPNYNWLGQPLASNATLGSMNFVSQLNAYDGVEANDFLEILAPNQVASKYVALVPEFGCTMAYIVTTSDATNVPVVPVSGYIIQRDASKPATVITLPAQVIAQ